MQLPKKSRRRTVRYSLLAANLALLAVVSVFVVQSRQQTNSSFSGSGTGVAALGENSVAINPLDQLSSADIAVHIARAAKLDEAQAVTNKADTVNAQLAVSSSGQSIITKPQVVSDGLKSRKDIQTYTVAAGDTVPSVAAKFAVTSDTIRWSNGLSGDALTPGKQLLISPVNGIIYLVKAGDTADSLADKYRANKELLIAINDAEIGGLPVGQNIIIPGGTPPAATVARASAVTSSGGFAWGGYSAVYGSNGYDYGYCTWWAATRRSQIGRSIPSNLGNASTWKVLAQRAGLGVGNQPAAGAVIWTPPRDYYGHVGFVESVNPDGSVNVSEMNVAGWGRVSKKTLSPAEAAAYSYIY
ncbi:MAG: LysM peptidoglycan-binding protein [Patescibacteria group bacterium]|nr:LysM peptidoglycan-binding protein [Patescibacteria group bacterium]